MKMNMGHYIYPYENDCLLSLHLKLTRSFSLRGPFSAFDKKYFKTMILGSTLNRKIELNVED